MTTELLSKGEQVLLVMNYNWQLRFNQYHPDSDYAVRFGITIYKTKELLDKIITDEDAKELLITNDS